MPTGRPIRIPFNENQKVDVGANSFTPLRGRPFLFQVLDPDGNSAFEYLLALHTNPEDLDEKMAKSKTVVMTYGGFVEFHWADELNTLSAKHTTGAFLGPDGLVAGFDFLQPADAENPDRKNTIAWERAQDLLELFRNNGLIYNGLGVPVLRGRVQLIYDRGIFNGHFTTFSITEVGEKPFSFDLNWEFKVEETVYKFGPRQPPRTAVEALAGANANAQVRGINLGIATPLDRSVERRDTVSAEEFKKNRAAASSRASPDPNDPIGPDGEFREFTRPQQAEDVQSTKTTFAELNEAAKREREVRNDDPLGPDGEIKPLSGGGSGQVGGGFVVPSLGGSPTVNPRSAVNLQDRPGTFAGSEEEEEEE